jgi:hypothetical protein
VSSLPVKPELGPTLPQLLRPWWRRAPRAARAAAVTAALLAGALLVLGALRGATSGDTQVVVEEPVAFNLRHGDALQRVDPDPGELLALRSERGDLFLQSFHVAPLRLPAYAGMPSGELPIVAERLKERLARRFAEFRLVEEGRITINETAGYEVVFTARSEDDRRLYGRWVMMVPVVAGERQGVVLELLGTPAAGIPNAEAIGDEGQLKLPMRSFRFGTDVM